MKIDVLRFLSLPDQAVQNIPARQTHALGGSTDIITPIDASGYGQWKHIKNQQGWPWDLKLYDEQYVYDWITEGPWGWSTDPNIGPKSFKKFVGNHTQAGKPGDGVPMFPRYVDTVDTKSEMVFTSDRTTYLVFENCAQTGPPRSLGAVRHVLRGPFALFHGGDVGLQPTLVHQYYWADANTKDTIPTLEENYYALGWGWVRWSLQTLNKKTGLYQVQKETLDTNYFRVPEVKVVFPCF